MKWRNVYDTKVNTMTTIETISWSKKDQKILFHANVLFITNALIYEPPHRVFGSPHQACRAEKIISKKCV